MYLSVSHGFITSSLPQHLRVVGLKGGAATGAQGHHVGKSSWACTGREKAGLQRKNEATMGRDTLGKDPTFRWNQAG